MKSVFLCMVIATALSVSACQKSDVYNTKSSINDTTLVGKDDDNNGIRDDIDALIKDELPAGAEQKAAMAYARQVQANILATDVTSDQAADMLAKQLKYATCLAYAAPNSGITDIQRIFASTVNNKPRLTAIQSLGDKAGSRRLSTPEEEECEYQR